MAKRCRFAKGEVRIGKIEMGHFSLRDCDCAIKPKCMHQPKEGTAEATLRKDAECVLVCDNPYDASCDGYEYEQKDSDK